MIDAKILAVSLLIVAAIVVSVALEISVWRECRSDHSWLYCIRVVAR